MSEQTKSPAVTLAIATLAIAIIAAIVAVTATALTRNADAQGPTFTIGRGQAEWADWSFEYDSPWSFDHVNPSNLLDTAYDGLALGAVTYQGVPILSQVSFPVMNVFYEDANSVRTAECGPYADRLGGAGAYTPKWRTFVDPTGVYWFEIGIEAQIGNYYIYQAYYFSDTGVMDMHVFSGGLQCPAYHEHLPFLRLDFDLGTNGGAGDRIMRRTPSGLVAEPIEFARSATDAINHEWWIADDETGDRVLISFDDGSYAPPNSRWPVSSVIAENNYARNIVYGLAWSPTEMNWGERNILGGTRTLKPGWVNGENIDKVDNVVWYTGYMPHAGDTEAVETWHSTGIRLSVLLGGDTCGGRAVTVDLSLGQLPTANDDVIMGTAGDDSIAAQAGNDYICGGDGNDTVWGQDGDDWIDGGNGNDKLRGGSGVDIMSGGPGSDDVDGGRDNDWVAGDEGADVRVRGGTGDDTVVGGDGDDLLVAGNGGSDVVYGGAGNDKVTGGPRPDDVHGNDGNDELKGNSGADRLYGGAGDDTLRGAKQPDLLYGGTGQDVCIGGTTGSGATEGDQAFECEAVQSVP